MIVWIDAQLPPALVHFFKQELKCDATPVRDLGLARSTDAEIYLSARARDAVLLTKDTDFLELSHRLGPPPRIVIMWCGNTSNARLKRLLTARWPGVLRRLESGEAWVEVFDE